MLSLWEMFVAAGLSVALCIVILAVVRKLVGGEEEE